MNVAVCSVSWYNLCGTINVINYINLHLFQWSLVYFMKFDNNGFEKISYLTFIFVYLLSHELVADVFCTLT